MSRRAGFCLVGAVAVYAIGACNNGSCPLGYSGGEVMPESTLHMTCTLTITGAAGQAAYDCPPPEGLNVPCVPQNGAPPVGAGRELTSPGGGLFGLSFSDSGTAHAASALANWIGGVTFSYSVACDGSVVLEVDGQEMEPVCPN